MAARMRFSFSVRWAGVILMRSPGRSRVSGGVDLGDDSPGPDVVVAQAGALGRAGLADWPGDDWSARRAGPRRGGGLGGGWPAAAGRVAHPDQRAVGGGGPASLRQSARDGSVNQQ